MVSGRPWAKKCTRRKPYETGAFNVWKIFLVVTHVWNCIVLSQSLSLTMHAFGPWRPPPRKVQETQKSHTFLITGCVWQSKIIHAGNNKLGQTLVTPGQNLVLAVYAVMSWNAFKLTMTTQNHISINIDTPFLWSQFFKIASPLWKCGPWGKKELEMIRSRVEIVYIYFYFFSC